MRTLIIAIALTLLASCATKPPVQEMAEARTALEAAQAIDKRSDAASRELKSAEQSLQEASEAIEKKQYEKARTLAIRAKLRAQKAARIKQISDSQ